MSCGDPGSGTFASKSGTSFVYGSKVTYACNTGYQVKSGSTSITCLSSKKWTGSKLVCTSRCTLIRDSSVPLSVIRDYSWFAADVMYNNGYILVIPFLFPQGSVCRFSYVLNTIVDAVWTCNRPPNSPVILLGLTPIVCCIIARTPRLYDYTYN